MAFVRHRHDMFHRGLVPYDQLATGTPEHGDVPTWNDYDEEVEWLPQEGGAADGDSLNEANVSGSHTIDRDVAAVHDLTLVGNSTLTPDHSDPPTGRVIELAAIIRQDGTGSRTLAWGGTIDWDTHDGNPPDMPTAANAFITVHFRSVDDAVSWIGYGGAGGGEAATTVESETTFGISPAVGTDTEYARQDHTHGTPANPVTAATVMALGRWVPVMDGLGNVTTDSGTGAAIMAWIT